MTKIFITLIAATAGIAAIVVVNMLWDATLNPTVAAEPVVLRNGGPERLVVHIDYETGCHYVRNFGNGGLTPRMNRDGRQICE